MDWSPRKFSPLHLRVCTLYWSGLTQVEIAASVGCSPPHVGRILETEQAREILKELSDRTLDSVLDVQVEAQAFAPSCLQRKFDLAMNSKDERVQNIACSDILAIAGHQPVRRVSIERPDSTTQRYKDMSEKEMRDTLLAELGVALSDSDTPETSGETGGAGPSGVTVH